MPDWTIETHAPEETEAVARALASRLTGGEIILLRGPLGAGKTLFAGALAAALGVREAVISPTFVIQRSYPTPAGLTLHHLDFYRLHGDEDLEPLGVEELSDERSVVMIEWPERCPGAFPDFTLDIALEVAGEESRRLAGRWGDDGPIPGFTPGDIARVE